MATSAIMLATLGVQEFCVANKEGISKRIPISWIFPLASTSENKDELGRLNVMTEEKKKHHITFSFCFEIIYP